MHEDKFDELKHRLDSQDGVLKEIKIAVCGDTAMGHTGIVEDVRELKQWRLGIDLLINRGKGASILIGFVITVAAVIFAALEAIGTWFKK